MWVKRHDVSGRRPYLKQGLGHKRVRYTDFKRVKFNSELEGVEENSVSPDMDVRLAFAVQDVPSEALAFSNKAEADDKRSQKLD